jgi:hypothetical protein
MGHLADIFRFNRDVRFVPEVDIASNVYSLPPRTDHRLGR